MTKVTNATFDFEIPKNSERKDADGNSLAGKKLEKQPIPAYELTDSEEEAQKYLDERRAEAKTDSQKLRWSLKGIVNKLIASAARANAYQSLLNDYLPVKPAADPEEAIKSAIRNLIASGMFTEEQARQMVEQNRKNLNS